MDILILLGLSLISGVFAMSEMAIVSSRRARLQVMYDEGNRNAKIALDLYDSPNRLISTTQIGITLVAIVSGAFGSSALGDELAQLIKIVIPALNSVADTLAVLIIVGLTTYLTIVVGELIPKRIALQNPERIASLVARPMIIIGTMATPLVWLFSGSTNLGIRLLGIRKEDEASVTHFEVLAMVEEGVNTGVFEEEEQDMVQAVFRLDESRIGSLITPRTEIVWIDLNDTPDIITQKLSREKYSSYPVGRGNVDTIVGIVQAKDLLAQILHGQPLHIEAVMSPPIFIPESVSVADAIQVFKKEGVHTVLVVSEYGGIEGLVRMHDIIEQIFGDLDRGEKSDAEADAIQREDGSWLLDGQYVLTRFTEHFPDFEIPTEENGKYETVAGFIMARLGRVPEATDHFEYQHLRFEVLDMDGVRIDKVLVHTTTHHKDAKHEST